MFSLENFSLNFQFPLQGDRNKCGDREDVGGVRKVELGLIISNHLSKILNIM